MRVLQGYETVRINITGSCEDREVKKVGDDLVPGESTYYLVLRFPDGRAHLAKVSEQAYMAYHTQVEKQMTASSDPQIVELARQIAAAKQDPAYFIAVTGK